MFCFYEALENTESGVLNLNDGVEQSRKVMVSKHEICRKYAKILQEQ